MNDGAGGPSAEEERERMLDTWERMSKGWGTHADEIFQSGRPVSEWMIEHLELVPGQRVLELAAGPGDTGFLAARRIGPEGRLISSDGAEAMVELARSRAAAQAIDNVEFKQLQLEWIDLPTASVDAILCRWGVMLLVDPDAALLECRRVLAPGGRIALAVWDEPARNPWATIPSAALIALGHVEPPPPAGPGMFALAAPGALADRLGDAGFLEPVVEALELPRRFESVEEWLDVTGDISGVFSATWRRLTGDQRDELVADITRRAEPYTAPDGSVELPGSSLVAVADA